MRTVGGGRAENRNRAARSSCGNAGRRYRTVAWFRAPRYQGCPWLDVADEFPEPRVNCFMARRRRRGRRRYRLGEPVGERARGARVLVDGPAAGSATGRPPADRPGWRAAPDFRCSSCATARETLVLCMWVRAPIALPVMTSCWPRLTRIRHSVCQYHTGHRPG